MSAPTATTCRNCKRAIVNVNGAWEYLSDVEEELRDALARAAVIVADAIGGT